MTIWVDKKGVDLGTGFQRVLASDPTWYKFSTDKVETKFYNPTTRLYYWVYPIGSTLTENTSFWARIDFTTPPSFANTFTPIANFGVYKISVGANRDEKNNFAFRHVDTTTSSGLYVTNSTLGILVDDKDTPSALSVSSSYYAIYVYNAVTNAATCDLYTSAGVLVSSYAGNIGAGIMSMDVIGIWSKFDPSLTHRYTDWWQLTAVKINSGTSEEGGSSSLADVRTDNVIIATTIKQPGETAWKDISTSVANVSIHRRINTATVLKMKLMNARDFISAKLTPNTKVRVTLGVSYTTGHFLFWGYIPPRKEYTDKVSIKGKDITYKEPNMITFNGVAHDVIEPASAEFLESDEDRESSEQDDIFKAQKHIMKNSEVMSPFDADDQWVNITAYDFIGKLTQEQLRFDEVTNVNNMEVFAGINIVINDMEEGDLAFGGGGSSPKKYIGDSKTDWKKFKDFIDEQMKRLEDDSNLTVENRKYYYYQSNHGTPTFVIKEWPNVLVDPVIIKTIAESEILKVNKGRRKQIEVTIQKALHLDIGDVVYIDADKYKLRGTYFLPELVHNYSATDCTTKLVLSEPGLIR